MSYYGLYLDMHSSNLSQCVTVGNGRASIKTVSNILVLLESTYMPTLNMVMIVLILLDQSGALGEYIPTFLKTALCVVFRCL